MKFHNHTVRALAEKIREGMAPKLKDQIVSSFCDDKDIEADSTIGGAYKPAFDDVRIKCRNHLMNTFTKTHKDLDHSVFRYNEIKSHGLAAISDEDIAYSEFDGAKALRACLDRELKNISYKRAFLGIVLDQLARIDAEILEIPQGYVEIDVILPVDKANIVKRWAKKSEKEIKRLKVYNAKSGIHHDKNGF